MIEFTAVVMYLTTFGQPIAQPLNDLYGPYPTMEYCRAREQYFDTSIKEKVIPRMVSKGYQYLGHKSFCRPVEPDGLKT